jgi:hypothetical protein
MSASRDPERTGTTALVGALDARSTSAMYAKRAIAAAPLSASTGKLTSTSRARSNVMKYFSSARSLGST